MIPLLLLTGNFFILIIALMGLQCCYFRHNWRWFWLMFCCVLLSAGCLGAELYQVLGPKPPRDLVPYARQLLTPL